MKESMRSRLRSKYVHEWSVVVYHQIDIGPQSRKAQTREGKIKTYREAVLWARNAIRVVDMCFLVEVCHVEKDKVTGKLEDVPVHKFFNSMGVWKQSVMKRPWFEGDSSDNKVVYH